MDKAKVKQANGLGEASTFGPSKFKPKLAEQAYSSGLAEPIPKSAEPIFSFNIPSPADSSLQSQPLNPLIHSKENHSTTSFSLQPQTSFSTISLRLQLIKPKGRNDKHMLGGISTVQGISKLKDSAGVSVHPD